MLDPSVAIEIERTAPSATKVAIPASHALSARVVVLARHSILGAMEPLPL